MPCLAPCLLVLLSQVPAPPVPEPAQRVPRPDFVHAAARGDFAQVAAQRSGGFVENAGQWPAEALFRVGARGVSAWFGRDGFTLARVATPARDGARGTRDARQLPRPTRGHAVRLAFEGARAEVRIEGQGAAGGAHHWLRGDDPANFVRGARAFERVHYSGLLPGVDLLVRGEEGPEGRSLFAYDLLLAPGAELASVVVRVEGAQGLRRGEDGGLVLETPLGELRQRAPVAWTVDERGQRSGVRVDFAVLGPDRYGFVGPDPGGRALVVDPGFQWGSFLGGGDLDVAQALALLPGGEPIVAGYTYSAGFPTSAGAFDPQLGGSVDAFVSALSRSGQHLLFSTYLGGGGDDFAYAVGVNAQGELLVGGETLSSDFPTPGGYRTAPYGGRDAFVARLDPSGANLLSATYLGGSGDEYLRALAVLPGGAVAVAGSTNSPAFPTVAGGHQLAYGGGASDAFVTRLDPTLGALVASTFLGGSQGEVVLGLAAHPDGSLLAGGQTRSVNFPIGSATWNPLLGGGADGFLARLGPQHAVTFATYFGGAADEAVTAVALGPQGELVAAGWSESTDLPLVAPAQPALAGWEDAFVARFDASGQQLLESTFLGGIDRDRAHALAVDAAGALVIAGGTWSPDFPTTPRAFDRSFASPPDAYQGDGFVARIQAGALAYSTFLGGAEDDEILGLALDASGQVFVAGHTSSFNFPTHPSAFDPSYDFSTIPDGFLARLDFDLYPLEYGQGKTTSMGWDVFLYHSGFPSLSAQNGLVLYVDAAYPNRPAWLFRGPAPAQIPFKGGHLLAAPPFTRVAHVQLDFVGGASVPVPTLPALVGTSAYFQFWFVDPGDPFGIGLSPAYEVTFYP